MGRLTGVVFRLSGGVSRYMRSLFAADAARLTLAGSLVRYGEMYLEEGGEDDLHLAETLARQAVGIYQQTAQHHQAQRARALVERITSQMRAQKPPGQGDPHRPRQEAAEADDRLAPLQSILGPHLTSRARYDLLLFWSRCPGGWSGRSAVDPQTRLPRQQIDQALDELVAEGVIRRVDDRHVAYFALTEERTMRDVVLTFGRLTNGERRRLFRLCSTGERGEAE